MSAIDWKRVAQVLALAAAAYLAFSATRAETNAFVPAALAAGLVLGAILLEVAVVRKRRRPSEPSRPEGDP